MSDTTHTFPNHAELVQNNRAYADATTSIADVRPDRKLAVVACMDSRMDIFAILGLKNGEAHIIRNAGGAVTDDAIRSLCLSQQKLGTREIVLLHHTDCGLLNLDEAAFKADLEDEVGVRPPWALEGFSDPFADVRQSIQRLMVSPFVPYTDHVSGFVYDVDSCELHEVLADGYVS